MEEPEVKLTVKEERFCMEYIKDFNATQAAIRAKYSKSSARQIGYENLTKPHIKNRVAALLEAMDMQEGEIKKRISDIAKTDMADYLQKKKVPYTPKVKVGLEVIISRLREEMEFEDEYALQVNLKDDELTDHMKSQEYRRRTIIRYKLELKRNPKAFRIINGETEMIEVAELDLVKLLDDKERGVIKSIKHTKDGVQAESYAADNALSTLAKFKGLQIDKSEVDMKADMNVNTVVRIGYGDSDQGA